MLMYSLFVSTKQGRDKTCSINELLRYTRNKSMRLEGKLRNSESPCGKK
jgi:hypothetical protein